MTRCDIICGHCLTGYSHRCGYMNAKCDKCGATTNQDWQLGEDMTAQKEPDQPEPEKSGRYVLTWVEDGELTVRVMDELSEARDYAKRLAARNESVRDFALYGKIHELRADIVVSALEAGDE